MYKRQTLLADTVGIIDKGVLLEENSMEELNKKNRKYIILEVSDEMCIRDSYQPDGRIWQ